MSLVKSPAMTERKVAANRHNQVLSHGPTTAEGKERIAAAQLRHGFYAKSQEVALRSLGEDPADYEELLEGLCQEFNPTGTLQEKLVIRLARVLWLADRADRRQEGEALRRAKSADSGRDNRLHARMMRLKMTAETLRSLARSAARWHYVTTPEDLEVMKKLHKEGVTTEMGEIALALFHKLQEPNTDEDGVSDMEKARRVVEDVKMMFGVGQWSSDTAMQTPAGASMALQGQGAEQEVEGPPDGDEGEDSDKDDRYPNISEEDWIARERARKLLKNILARQVEVCETQRRDLLKESLAGPSPYELAADNAPSNAEALLMRRMQDANMREVRRLTNLLLKIKRQGRHNEPEGASDEGRVCHDVQENKEG